MIGLMSLLRVDVCALPGVSLGRRVDERIVFILVVDPDINA